MKLRRYLFSRIHGFCEYFWQMDLKKNHDFRENFWKICFRVILGGNFEILYPKKGRNAEVYNMLMPKISISRYHYVVKRRKIPYAH